MSGKQHLSLAQYISLLQNSGLMKREDIAQVLEKFKSRTTESQKRTAGLFGRFLVQQDLITDWHHGNLMKGQFKGCYLGKYKLLRPLGAGGMGTVYHAEHTLMRRQVAIKLLPISKSKDLSFLDRFRTEAQAVAALDHPNIVQAFSADNVGDRHYLVMEFVDGDDLQSLVEDEGPVEYEDAADYVAQAARGLAHAHERGIIHRDIKPANLLLNSEGVVKILDMGLARLAEGQSNLVTCPQDDSTMGTPDYIAPEQARDSHNIDERADIYSLGGSLYFLLTGHPPFPEGTVAQRLMKHQYREPASIYEDRPDAPEELVAICQKMMAKQPDERFQSADEVAETLEGWLEGEPVSIDLPVTMSFGEPGEAQPMPAGRRGSDNTTLIIGGSIGACVLVIGLLVMLIFGSSSSPEEVATAASEAKSPGDDTAFPAFSNQETPERKSQDEPPEPTEQQPDESGTTTSEQPSAFLPRSEEPKREPPREEPKAAPPKEEPKAFPPPKEEPKAFPPPKEEPKSEPPREEPKAFPAPGEQPNPEEPKTFPVPETPPEESVPETVLAEVSKWETKLREEMMASPSRSALHPLQVSKVEAKGMKFEKQSDGSYLATGNPDKATYTIIGKTNVRHITGIRLEALADDRLPKQGPGRSGNGNFVVSSIKIGAAPSNDFKEEHTIELLDAGSDFSQEEYAVNSVLKKGGKGWAILPQAGQNHWALLTPKKVIDHPKETWFKIELAQNYGTRHLLGRFRIFVMTGYNPSKAMPQSIYSILAAPAAERGEVQTKKLVDYHQMWAAVDASKAKYPQLPAVPNAEAFVEFPQVADLPAIGEDQPGNAATQPVALGRVLTQSKLTLELLGAETAYRGSRTFRVEPAKKGKTWDVSHVSSRGGSGGVAIAELKLKKQALEFRWTEQALKDKIAPHLRNCLLQLKCDGAERVAALRKPMTQQPLVVKLDRGRQNYRMELEDLPDPKNLFVEVVGLEGQFDLATFNPNGPIPAYNGNMWILLGQFNKQVLAFEIGTKVGSSLQITMSPYFKVKGSPQPIPFIRATAEAAAQQAGALQQQLSFQLSATNDGNKKKDIEKELKKVQEQVRQFTQLNTYYQNINDQGAVHLRVFCRAGEHEVTLATTNPPQEGLIQDYWVQPEEIEVSSKGTRFKELPDGSFLAVGFPPVQDEYLVKFKLPAQRVSQIRLETLGDPSLPKQGPGRNPEGKFILSPIGVRYAPAAEPKKWSNAKIKETFANGDYSKKLNADWESGGSSNQWCEYRFDKTAKVSDDGGMIVEVRLPFPKGPGNSIGRFRLSVCTRP